MIFTYIYNRNVDVEQLEGAENAQITCEKRHKPLHKSQSTLKRLYGSINRRSYFLKTPVVILSPTIKFFISHAIFNVKK